MKQTENTQEKVSAPDNAQITESEVREIFNKASTEAYAQSWRTRASEAESQRDELLAACKALIQSVDAGDTKLNLVESAHIRAAIANVEGK